jgi:hypothetical protein
VECKGPATEGMDLDGLARDMSKRVLNARGVEKCSGWQRSSGNRMSGFHDAQKNCGRTPLKMNDYDPVLKGLSAAILTWVGSG